MPAEAENPSDTQKIAELKAVIQAVRDRVRARYPEPNGTPGPEGSASIRISIADLMPVVHARDAAQAKIAAIGAVNPRRGGLINDVIQVAKKTIARSLQWFVRDQISFNREAVAAIEAVMEALNDHNRILLSLASQADALAGRLDPEVRELRDIRHHWIEWRGTWEKKLAANEVQFLRSVADLQGAIQHRATLMESNFREIVKAQHVDYLGAIDRATIDIQKRLWADLEKIRQDYERIIHTELRLIRQRTSFAAAPEPQAVSAVSAEPRAPTGIDYGRFAERFRGSEEYVREALAFYRPLFAGCENVLDIGCGRGEFLGIMRDAAVYARGIDLSAESVTQCREKGLEAEAADLFTWLASQPEGEFDGIFSSQVVEHLAPGKLPEMIRLCAHALRRDGILVIETPNPECLAIFATHFYLDPTHVRPIPHPLLSFYMEEAGFGRIDIHPRSPAVESIPELAELPEKFRERLFGGLDYAIVGHRL